VESVDTKELKDGSRRLHVMAIKACNLMIVISVHFFHMRSMGVWL